MLDCLKAINWKRQVYLQQELHLVQQGIKILSSDDAKNVYSNCTAAVLRAKELCYERYINSTGKCRRYLC